jgi:hypothetical protein
MRTGAALEAFEWHEAGNVAEAGLATRNEASSRSRRGAARRAAHGQTRLWRRSFENVGDLGLREMPVDGHDVEPGRERGKMSRENSAQSGATIATASPRSSPAATSALAVRSTSRELSRAHSRPPGSTTATADANDSRKRKPKGCMGHVTAPRHRSRAANLGKAHRFGGTPTAGDFIVKCAETWLARRAHAH